jgi:beta-N-acetylhexosaminidase
MLFKRLNYNEANRRQIKKVWAGIGLFFLIISTAFGQLQRNRWVDSTFQTLSFEAKIGQLIVMPVNAYARESEQGKIEDLIKSYGIGGIVFTNGSPALVSSISQQLQQRSPIPLLLGLNAEEGLGSTLDSTLIFPQMLMLGAIQNDSLVYYFGKEVGRQLKAIGIQLAFAPTADLSTTYLSDDMIAHTFGDNPQRVSRAAVQYMKGLQQEGIIPVAKHYPTYALRVQDYYKGSPIMQMVQEDKNSLVPLQSLINNGCPAIFASYKHNPIFPDRRAILSKKNRIIPEALPSLYTADYLKKNLNFNGLVFSYVPDVKVVLKKYQPGDSETYAFLAGNDVLMFPGNISATVRKLRKQIKKEPGLALQLDNRVKKVLAFKYDAGLHTVQPATGETPLEKLNTLEAKLLQNDLFEHSVTVIRDDDRILPIKTLDNTTFASLSIGERKENDFAHYLDKYARFDHYELHQPGQDTTELIEALSHYDIIVAGIFLSSDGVKQQYPAVLNTLARHTRIVVANLGPVSKINAVDIPAMIQGYVDGPEMRRILPQVIFGGLPATGVLPLSVNERLREGMHVPLTDVSRLSFAVMPEAAGLNSQTLDRIADVVREAIDSQATPGCQVIVTRNGKVVYDRAFGWQTYDNQIPVNQETMYDLASMTKVLGTLQAVMFLYDRGMLDLDRKVAYYLPELQSTNKKDIILKDVLTHQAGLVPFVPLWNNTVGKGNEFLPQYYSKTQNERYPLQVAPDLFASPVLIDSLWKWTFESKMIEKTARTPYPFRYSDIGFWILHRLVEKLINQPLDEFLEQNLYEPIGAFSTGFNPLNRFPASAITPTEFDKVFRKSMIHGTVHDERAAMLGGVAGHAGLFSNAFDVAKLGQMLLLRGSYGGHQYLKPETVDLFIKKQFETSRRGLGWDKPIQSDWTSPTSLYASPLTFGHTGFTGTCIWVDPEFDLVYVFLSNRVYPDRSTKLITTNIRSRIQDIIYKSIFEFCPYPNPNLWSRSR